MPLLAQCLPINGPAGLELGWPQGIFPPTTRRIPELTPVATLYKRGPSWYLQWSHEGRQHRSSLGKVEKREAEAFRTKKEAELAGLITTTRGVTVGQVLGEYLDWYATARPTTIRQAKSALSRFRAEFDHRGAEDLPPAEIERWTARQDKRGQAEKALKLSRAAFRRAIAQRQLTHSPMAGVSIPRPMTSRAPPYYTPPQLAKLAKVRHGALWMFLANTGLRRGEIAKATRDDLRDGGIYVESEPHGRTKNLRWRVVPLNAAAKRALKALGSPDLVDCHADTLGDWFTAEARSVGLKGTLHWLRHTFCTGLAQSGVSLHEIKSLAGHSSITVTEQYSHHQPGYGQSAVGKLAGWGKRKR